MSSSQKDAVERGYEADQRAVVWAFFTTLVTLVMIGVNLGFMYSHMGQRVMLTSIEVFHDWGGLRQIFQDTVSLDPRFNLPSLDYYTHFDTSSASLMVIKDLHSRGLMSDGDFKNASALFNQSTGLPLTGALDPRLLSQLASEFFGKFSGNLTALVLQGLPTSVVVSAPGLTDPRLLSRLLSVSGCSFPDALPGATPTTRSAGCRCIAESYLGFVKASANMTTNITAAVRERGGAEALKCLDRRVTWHTWGAGDMWTIHPVGLAFYSSSILFLTCVGFLIPFYHQHLFPESWDVRFRTLAIKLTLAGLTGVLVLLFALHDFLANLFQILGLVLVLSNFLFSLSSVLDYPGKGAMFREPFKPEPHPLVVSFWVNFPMLLPAPLVAVAISGYIRDVYAVGAIAVIGAVVGIIMQRVFWYVWYDDHKFLPLVFPPLLFALFDLFVLLGIILLAYSSNLTVYSMSSPGAIFAFLAFVVAVGLTLWYDFHVYLEVMGVVQDEDSSLTPDPAFTDLNQRFEDGQHALLFLFSFVMLIALTALTCIDSKLE